MIEDIGEIRSIEAKGDGSRWVVATRRIPAGELAIGESVAVDGCCLTVVERREDAFVADLSPETLRRTTAGDQRVGSRVNLERALAFGDRLGGHLVQGHVDGTGTIVSRREVGDFLELWIEGPEAMAPWLIWKGSVTVDGISLTVNELGEGARFSVMLIPETRTATTLGDKDVGARLNLEGDVIGKYVERLLQKGRMGGTGESLGEKGSK